MYVQIEKPIENSFPTKRQESRAIANSVTQKQSDGKQVFGFVDNRPEMVAQKKENKTGLPDNLKVGIENLSGYSMDDVKVHYNSGKPAQLSAHAYAQGVDIHLAAGQEKHLPHEAWHVVQQKQVRVKPTMQMKDKVNVNDDAGLEKEADTMGVKAMNIGSLIAPHVQRQVNPGAMRHPKPFIVCASAPVQRQMLVGCEMETMVPIYENGNRPDHVDGYAAQATDYAHHNVDFSLSMPLGDSFEIHVDSSQLAYRSALDLLNPDKKIHIAELVAKPVSSMQALLTNLKIARNYLSIFERNYEVIGTNYSIGWPRPTADWEGASIIPRQAIADKFENDDRLTHGRLFQVSTQLTFQGSPEKLERISDMDFRKYTAGISTVMKERPVGAGKNRKMMPMPLQVLLHENHPIVNTETMAAALGMVGNLGEPLVRRAVSVTVKIFKDALNVLQSESGGTIKNKVPYLIRSDLGCLFANEQPEVRNQFARAISDAIKALKAKDLNLPPKLLETIYSTQKDGIILNPRNYKALIDPQGDDVGELEHVNKNLIGSLTHIIRDDSMGILYWPWESAMKWLANEVFTAVSTEETVVTGPLHGSQNLYPLAGRDPQQEFDMLNTREQIARGWVADPERAPLPDDIQVNREVVMGPAVVFEDRTPLQIDISGNELPVEVVTALERVGFVD